MSDLMWVGTEETRQWVGDDARVHLLDHPGGTVTPKQLPDVTELHKLHRPHRLASPSSRPTLCNMNYFCILEDESNALDHTKYFLYKILKMYRRHLVVNIIIPFGLNIFRLLITHIPICVSCTAVNSTHCSQPLPPPHPINIF